MNQATLSRNKEGVGAAGEEVKHVALGLGVLDVPPLVRRALGPGVAGAAVPRRAEQAGPARKDGASRRQLFPLRSFPPSSLRMWLS